MQDASLFEPISGVVTGPAAVPTPKGLRNNVGLAAGRTSSPWPAGPPRTLNTVESDSMKGSRAFSRHAHYVCHARAP